jgi:hypothetical protein
VTALVLPRLYAGGWPLLRPFGIAIVTLGVGVIVSLARQMLLPIPPVDEATPLGHGLVAFLAAGFVASAAGYALWEVKSTPGARNLPGLARRARREIELLGFVTFGVASGLGGAWHGAIFGASGFIGVAAMLGFTIGLVNTLDPTRWNQWLGGLPMVLLAFVPLFFLPEIARLVAHGGILVGAEVLRDFGGGDGRTHGSNLLRSVIYGNPGNPASGPRRLYEWARRQPVFIGGCPDDGQ